MIKKIIFDIGNVLTDFRWHEFLQDKGFKGEELQALAKASVLSPVWNELDRGVWSFEQVMAGFISNAPELSEQIQRAFDDMSHIVTMRDYAVPWVKSLRKRGYAVYYLSNFSEKIERECMDALVFREEMNGGIMSYRDKVTKPDPAIYKLFLNRFGLKPQECVFLDDSPINVNAAREQGINAILFVTKESAQKALDDMLR